MNDRSDAIAGCDGSTNGLYNGKYQNNEINYYKSHPCYTRETTDDWIATRAQRGPE